MAPGGQRVFGQAMQKNGNRRRGGGGASSRYQRQFGNKGTVYRSADNDAKSDESRALYRRQKQAAGEALDDIFGIERFAVSTSHKKAKGDKDGEGTTRQRRGWLYNILSTTVTVSNDASTAATGGPERAGLDLYFCTESGKNFKSTILYRPFFYLLPDLTEFLDANCGSASEAQVEVVMELLTSTLNRYLEGSVYHIEVVYKTDLDQPNHLSPDNSRGRPVLKLVFDNVSLLMEAREQLREVVDKNKKRGATATFAMNVAAQQEEHLKDPLRLICDMREYDVPYVVRVCTDLDIRVGTWYTVELEDELEINETETGGVTLTNPDRESKADPSFLAFDIECTKAPLKFPSAEVDEIFMISYMVSTSTGPQGYLIVSRSVVSEDIDDFEYTPKPTYPGPFKIFNEANEKALLERFFSEFRKHHPQIVVTYNGDFFDWPFVDARAQHHGLDLFKMTGVEKVGEEYRGRCSVHLDAFNWVQRDSYLPQGSQGLKAVTKYKLGYDPVEVDPEDMVRFAQEKPTHMATYSVSDAVATYYLYEKYVHLFIFSLCTIIPMGPEDVLRKGSGTLCEALLMVQACTKDIICPNKQVDPVAKFHKGHLLESETYIGGKVECLETGVYRSDLEYDFDLDPKAFQRLIDNIDRDLTFAIEVEGGLERKDIANYDEIRSEIIESLELLRDRPKRTEGPYVYHLDVGAMYPNIILSNRLQPSAMVNDADCAACDFNQAKNGCKRRMEWIWRGDFNPATRNEYERTKDQLSREVFDENRTFQQLSDREQAGLVSTRLKNYARKAYKKTKVTQEETRQDVVCMRENPFYVDTVRDFRDRRYEYKKMNKEWKKKVKSAKDAASKKHCEDKVLVYDSLQVAHKCILNSFYGYVMRKGARWRSMEMAGIVTRNGAQIILQARELVERIGRPLELDTDGIWCILPNSFPDVYTFKTTNGSKFKLEYPCVMLNAACHEKFTNHQYQTLIDPERGTYSTRSECSIFFEVDGPYRCMFLPASTEEGKLLKKRYAVFNFDKSLAELKGFELKRRGELELIKRFQEQVFERFLDGDTLEECYASAADIANHWIDVIDTRGESLDDEELVDLISENRNMSRQLEDYGDQKGTSQTTARRLGEFLGSEIIKDKGLNCKFIIAEQPYGSPVTERAIPTAIWKAEPSIMKHYLRKWLKAPGLDGDALDMRNVLDWDYYLDRLGKTIQKIITIPAALQKVDNPVPRVEHPKWLETKVNQSSERFQQQSIRSMFAPKVSKDIEDIEGESKSSSRAIVTRFGKPRRSSDEKKVEDNTPRVVLSDGNFSDWLKQKKTSWRRDRKERKGFSTSRGVSGLGGVEKRQRKALSMEGYVREAAKTLTQREWQIIEVRSSAGGDLLSYADPASGEFTVWVMVGNESLQKIKVSVPRVIYISTRREIRIDCDELLDFRQVDKHLPHNRSANFVYEITMPEYTYRSRKWIKDIKAVDEAEVAGVVIEAMFESETPLSARIIASLGAVARLRGDNMNKTKSYMLSDISRVDRPSEGEYLGATMSYRRVFLYIRIHPKTKTGIVALYSIDKSSGGDSEDSIDHSSTLTDPTRPSRGGAGSFDVGASCRIWVVKPGVRRGQKNLSLKQCEAQFSQLLQTIQDAAGLDSEYSCVAPSSCVRVASLNFVESEDVACAGANEAINSGSKSTQGPTFIMLNSNRPVQQIRRYLSTFSSFPVIYLPFPPGPAHNPAISTLPSLNWEQPAVQLCLEAYLFSVVISYPKRVSYSRYGHIPVANLGRDENFTLYDTSLSRLIQKNRALSWASVVPGQPDLGINFLPSSGGGVFPTVRGTTGYSQDEIWGDDDELVSPVIRRPGCYRSVCVDIDLQDLVIAALTDMSSALSSASYSGGPDGSTDVNSPTSVALVGSNFGVLSKVAGPLGDEMATSVSLPIIRAIVNGWLSDAYATDSLVADELLHHIYRLVSCPDSLLYDPALHRTVHSLMKATFLRVLGELQRLGCSIVYASFHRITVATGKLQLVDAEEYVDFVISTIRKRASDDSSGLSGGDSLGRVSLRPRQFYTHLVFLDEFNFGSVQLEKVDREGLTEEELAESIALPIDNESSAVVLPSVVTGWSLMNYLGSRIAQIYFRGAVGRFSNDVFRKQMELYTSDVSADADEDDGIEGALGRSQRLLNFKKRLVSKHLASLLTRAVDEILKRGVEAEEAAYDAELGIEGGNDDLVKAPLMAVNGESGASRRIPALEFIKSIGVLLELDPDVEKEVHVLKRSLLAQVGVAEYARIAQWINPCPRFIVPDVFCSECHESRDVNVCYVPPKGDDDDDDFDKCWVCEDCGMQYDPNVLEGRLISLLHRKVARYQLQDVRCGKSQRIVTRVLSPQAECSGGVLQLDIPASEAESQVLLLKQVAEFYELESLQETTTGLLKSYE